MFKKILAILSAIAIMFISTGCGSNKSKIDSNDLSGNFTCSAGVQYKDMNVSAKMTRTGTGLYEIELLSPENMKGLKFKYADGQIQVSYMGFNITLNENNKMASAFSTLAVTVLENIARGVDLKMSEKGNELIIKGSDSIGEYTATVDIKEKALKSLEIPSQQFKCNFYDFEAV